MKIQTTILNSASLSSLFNGSTVTLIPSSSIGTNININNIVWKLRYSSSPYDVPADSYFNLSLLYFSVSSSLLYYPGVFVNYSLDYLTNTPINLELPSSSSLILQYSGSVPTTGNSTLQLDIYYDTQNVTNTDPGFTFDNKTSFNAPVSIGDSVEARGSGSLALGLGSIANNNYSYAEGSGSLTSGLYSHAEGSGTHAKKSGSHAEGQNTISDGNYSHAEGSNTTTTGVSSHAEGKGTLAIGNYSHAEGDTTIAFGESSHASGLGTIASGSNQAVVGTYNRRNNTTDLFVIGNGASDGSRSDIFNVSSTSVRITGSLNVSGGITGSLSGSITSSSFATSASYALTASSIPNLVTGASGEILYSGGSNNILSTGNFVYNSSRDSVTLDRNEDYNGITLSVPIDRYAIGHKNSAYNINSLPAYCRNYYFVYQVTDGTTALLSTLTAKSGTNLSMYGLKCDYCLTISDPSVSPVEVLGTRTGIFTCAWDSNGTNVQLTDDVKSIGDTTIGELTNVTFTINWSGDDIQLNIDTTGVVTTSDIGFMGYFTLFTS